jgi:signal transduction histidine kinase
MVPQRIKTLLIENNRSDADMVRHALVGVSLKEPKWVFDVKWVETLSDGLKSVALGGIDVVITDLGLSDSHGLETVRGLMSRAPYLPIVVMTGSLAEDRGAMDALQLGAQDYLIKGQIDPLLLASTLRYAMERKRLEVDLRHSRDALARSNQELQQLTHSVSHDLQEPIRSVSVFIRLLATRCQGKLDREADECIAFALEGLDRVSHLVSDLLHYSQIGGDQKPFQSIDCELLLKRVLISLQSQIEESHAVITHDPLPTVMGEDLLLVPLFQNLIGNAIKFAKAGEAPHLHLSAIQMENDTAWCFSVKDNGIGIDALHFDKIFIIFQRLHLKDAYPGTGVGLAICKKVVEKHGGRIWVTSVPGAGSTFCFTIPIPHVASAISVLAS